MKTYGWDGQDKQYQQFAITFQDDTPTRRTSRMACAVTLSRSLSEPVSCPLCADTLKPSCVRISITRSPAVVGELGRKQKSGKRKLARLAFFQCARQCYIVNTGRQYELLSFTNYTACFAAENRCQVLLHA